jgi:beta-aspartyl-peptidase (threonine type)
VEQVPNEYFVTDARRAQLARTQALPGGGWELPGHGTIGAVARDLQGNVAAGTSTGGVCNQRPGRVGDSPICGAGTYANQETVAVSCTGTGEKFIQEVAAGQIHARVLWAGQTPAQAAAAVLEAVEDRGGDGGVIVVPARGEGVVARNACAQMDYGYAYGEVRVTHQ